MPGLRRVLSPLLLATAMTFGSMPCAADIKAGQALEAHILLDASGSMWPGFDPNGVGPSRIEAGEEFYWNRTWFLGWLDDFVAAQRALGVTRVSLSALQSPEPRFSASDLELRFATGRLTEFRASAALGSLGDEFGQYTPLAPALARLSSRFEGLVWVLTDNIVDDGTGRSDQDVLRYFRQLRDDSRYHSVHLFKLPVPNFRSKLPDQPEPALAVYGMLVSPSSVSNEVKSHYDQLFQGAFLDHRRPGGRGTLFPPEQHLKLKDLGVDALRLEVRDALTVDVGKSKGSSRENEISNLEIPCSIRSNLTQHTVKAGTYRLQARGGFQPEGWAREALGLKPLEASEFQSAGGNLGARIGPGEIHRMSVSMKSKEPLVLEGLDLGAWLRAALRGVRVKYTGTVEMTFRNVQVDLERGRLEGIFGVEGASEIFDVQDVRSIQVAPARAQVTFLLDSSSRRSLLLLLVLCGIGIPLGILGWFLTRKVRYRVHIGTTTRDVALRRLQSHVVQHEGYRLGKLTRAANGEPAFRPETGNASIRIEPRDELRYDVSIQRIGTLLLAVEVLGDRVLAPRAASRKQQRVGGGAPIRRPDAVLAPKSPSPPPPPGRGAAPRAKPTTDGSSKPRSPRGRPTIRRP